MVLFLSIPSNPGPLLMSGPFFVPMKPPPPTSAYPAGNALTTFLIVAASSIFFCTKGVFVKLAYGGNADAISVLALRMGFAFPFFVLMGWWHRGKEPLPLTKKDWARLIGLGFFGYYLSSYMNFAGLQYISVGMERVTLYTYPALVLLGQALLYRKRISRPVMIATLVSYLGIVCAFMGEAHAKSDRWQDLALGTWLVFSSAVTYAVFILVSGQTVKRLGAARFTSCVVGVSCVFVLLHFCLTRPADSLLQFPVPVYGYGLILAIFGTVIPSYLLGLGLQRASAQKFAVISTVGPVVTLLLAWAVLHEPLRPVQLLGFFLSLAGGVTISFLKEKES